jgi:predicted ABC-type transport system involved in lysophospholipase L1 biosynthesis ATPase subunit
VTVLLSFANVSKSFWRGSRELAVLKDVTLEVCAGELVGVLASRAAGKSTLLRVAAGLERPDSGRVLFDDGDLWGLSDARRAGLLSSEIGWVAAQPPELDVPLLTLVALPMFTAVGREQAHVQARKTLARVGVSRCAEQYWESLADWERALAAIAVGVGRSPKLLLVDDLTATLGLSETEEVLGLLRGIAGEGAAVLMGTSDGNATKAADRIATLAGGELLVPSGAPQSPAKLIEFPGAHRQARRADPRG